MTTQGPGTTRTPDFPASGRPAELRRALSLPLLVLYGLGVTIGAGIYVLIGATAGRAGVHAPLSFVIAALVMGFSAASFAELSTRYPVSAGEAAYVRGAFNSGALSLFAGGLVVFAGIVSASAISVGAAGYLGEFLALPRAILIAGVVIAMGAIAAWGIVQSVAFAGLFTVVEIGGLAAIVIGGFGAGTGLRSSFPEALPQLADTEALAMALSAGLLAFFAVIGFEDIVNLAEETRNPERVLPWAIFLTLAGTTVVYVLVAHVAVWSGPVDELAASRAPLSLVFTRTTGLTPAAITAIAVVATLNGIIVQMVMSARVLYGLARQASLPAIFARIDPRTRTPLFSTAVVVAVILALALLIPLEALAEATSLAVLTSFTLVNLSLVRLKLARRAPPAGAFRVWAWVPVAGFLSCLGFLAGTIAALLGAF